MQKARLRSGSEKMLPAEKEPLVAIPLLPVRAATPGEKGDRVADLDQLKPEGMLAAPQWCPNPASTISVLVKGSSMSPLILDGYIIAVDTSDTAHDDLMGKIVVAWNREQGLLVLRSIRFDHTDVLVSDHRDTCRSHWRLSRSGASSAECCGGPGSQAENRRQPSLLHPRNVA
jgi:Peptidase S24-like